ncbi:trimethylamine methyltransferase family protein [Roseovarius sp.]|uniref:trimethylamine methyltransferase family protein n=2 Tax=Roseovarius TaxID=74030 RepID=UPI003A988463
MSSKPRRRRSASPRDREAGAHLIPQLPWQQPSNPYPPMKVLSDDQVEVIHHASLRVLEELGIELMSAEARQMFRDAGADVDDESEIVRIAPELLEQLISTAPSEFTLRSRNLDKALKFGGNHMAFGLVAGPPSVHDNINGRRSGNLKDFENFTRLAHHFNAIHIIGNQVCAPMELPANNRHLDTYNANLTLSDLCFHCTSIGKGRAMDGIKMMAISKGLTLEQAADDPGVTTIISVNSPRRFDGDMADGLIAMSSHGQAVAVTPFTLMGAMTPVTLAAGLTQQNAEALFGIALTQLARKGAPVFYGAYTSNVDMRSGAPAFGTPENAKANIASGQLARRYGLPYRASPTNASNVADAQAAYETEMALWACMLGHANLHYHAAGWLEGGLCASFEKLVLDVEMLQHKMAFLEPIKINEAELAFEAMSEVPTGGHFFGSPHTMERYETAFYRPLVSNWTNHENWELAGAKDATTRATDLWQQALKEYEQPPLEPAIREELDAYIAKRKEEIGSEEP